MILVTGGTGFLGAHLLYHLTTKGEKVKALKRNNSSTKLLENIFSFYTNNPAPLIANIEWVEGDILDVQSLIEAFKNIELIYHTAAMVSFDPNEREKLLETNINGTANVVNAALSAGVTKLCHVSSIAALGRAGNNDITNEESPWIPYKNISAYAISKHEGELEVWRGMAEGLKTVIVNPSVILGPGNWNAGSSKLFTTVFNGLKVYTKGINGYIDVNDVAKAMIWLIDNNIYGKHFALNSENISYKQLFEWMANALQVTPPTIKAGRIASATVWRILKIISLFSNKPPFITKDTALTANKIHRYSSEKFKSISKIKFISVYDSIKKTSDIFIKNYTKH